MLAQDMTITPKGFAKKQNKNRIHLSTFTLKSQNVKTTILTFKYRETAKDKGAGQYMQPAGFLRTRLKFSHINIDDLLHLFHLHNTHFT